MSSQTAKRTSSSETEKDWAKLPLHEKLAIFVQDLIGHDIDLKYAKQQLECAYIRRVLDSNKGNIGAAANILGMHRNTLSKRIKDLDILVQKPIKEVT